MEKYLLFWCTVPSGTACVCQILSPLTPMHACCQEFAWDSGRGSCGGAPRVQVLVHLRLRRISVHVLRQEGQHASSTQACCFRTKEAFDW